MLDKRMLDDMPAETVFATGIVLNERLHGAPVRWVAKRGGIHDWAIYYHLANSPLDFVSRCGDKVFTDEVIRALVPCDDEALALYRL